MTPEEYQKFKEAEKEHLRKIRELKKAHQQHARKSTVTRAVTDMAASLDKLYDEHREMVDRLQMDTLHSEARMEVALDAVDMEGVTEAEDAAALELDAEALKKAKARELIRQMKGQSGESISEPDATTASDTKNPDSPEQAPEAFKGRTPLNEKPKPRPSSDLPEKTIGKMKP